MSRPGSYVPAWKRLGLKLRNANQSGHAVPESIEPSEHKVIEQQARVAGIVPSARNGSPPESHQGRGPPQNGKPSSLGKRKTADPPADGHEHALKKSRNSERRESPDGRPASTFLIDFPAKNEAPGSRPLPAETGGQQRPKGDPNYRKKKSRSTDAWSQRAAHSNGHAYDAQTEREVPHRRKENSTPGEASHRQPHHEGRPSHHERSPTNAGDTLRVSTENGFSPSPPLPASEIAFATPRLEKKAYRHSILTSSPPRSDRRKSVTFTPDTKTTDGNSATALFQKWADQNGHPDSYFEQAEVAGWVVPPKVHPANDVAPTLVPVTKENSPGEKAEKKTKGKKQKKAGSAESNKSGKDVSTEDQPEVTPTSRLGKSDTDSHTATPKQKTKKKDPSIYLQYLSEYHNDRENWKFNKAKQNDVVDNALNVFRIGEEFSEALLQYIAGLQGAGVIARLTKHCETRLKELDEEDKKAMSTMDDPEVRKAAKEEAVQLRLAQEKKRRRTQEDIEGLANSANPDGYIRRLKRRRAEALLSTLSRTAPLHPIPASRSTTLNQYLDPKDDASTKARRRASKAKKSKSRTQISSDEDSSSDSSSSDDPSSSDTESEESEAEDSASSVSSEDEDEDSGADSASSGSESEGSSSSSDSE
ncbi:hypothetical protein BCR34DRAFT_561202 [Clohesyomyces aquaticus]|uniref:WKF domain-containing protein n=1 Tax=Clohesyomyces aquaticus TaxID=1231657 RepID=A0A1Y1ZV56_9PLEO|nr:hypothetical protein BCR34DRAFT_561202 [Clohesyomyces aquaticus]